MSVGIFFQLEISVVTVLIGPFGNVFKFSFNKLDKNTN